jgi:hypothetical protein
MFLSFPVLIAGHLPDERNSRATKPEPFKEIACGYFLQEVFKRANGVDLETYRCRAEVLIVTQVTKTRVGQEK